MNDTRHARTSPSVVRRRLARLCRGVIGAFTPVFNGLCRAMTKLPDQAANAYAALASPSFLAISVLSLRALGDSSSALAFARKASRPPRWSTVLSAFAEMRSLKARPSASDISVTLSRFGRNRRLVLMFEWLTLWPTRGPLAVSSQRRDMV